MNEPIREKYKEYRDKIRESSQSAAILTLAEVVSETLASHNYILEQLYEHLTGKRLFDEEGYSFDDGPRPILPPYDDTPPEIKRPS